MTFDYEGFTFGKLRIPCHVYENGEFSFNDVKCIYDDSSDPSKPDSELPYLTQEIVDLRNPLVEKRRKEAEERGAPFFDGKQVRFEDFGVDFMDDSEEEKILTLKFGPSTWFTYNATNKSLDTGMVSDDGKLVTVREKYVKDPLNLNDNLANSTGASTTVISIPDGRLVYVRRGKLSQYPDVFGDAAAGFMSMEKDLHNESPNPFLTFARETKEEMGILCEPRDFKLLGIGRAMDDLHGEIWGELRTNHTVEEIRSFPKSHKYEHLRILDIPFDPKEVAKIFRDQLTAQEWKEKMKMWIDPEEYPTVPEWVPAHAVNAIHSLILEFGYDAVIKHFR